MNAIQLQEPQFLLDSQGNPTYAVLSIDEYNHMADIVRLYEEFDELNEEDLKKIAIAREQAKLGLGVKSDDVHKKVQEIWK